MARSYLYGGDTRHLTPIQYELEQLYDRLDTPQRRLSSDDFFKSNEFAQFLSGKYGDLADQVPPGSQILKQTPFKIEYKDADGYTHTITRAGADAATAGAIARQTDRPSILPQKQNEEFQQQLQKQLQQLLSQPQGLAQLPPEVQQQLNQIDAAEKARNQQTFADQSGDLIARLYGNRVNQSSIANEAAGRLAQLQALVGQQQQSDSAARGLGVQQYLTGLGQQRTQDIAGLYSNLAGLGTQRDIAGAGLGLDAAKLDETIRQFNKSYGLQDKGLTLEQQRIDNENSTFNKFIKGIYAAAALAGGGGTAYGAYKSGSK